MFSTVFPLYFEIVASTPEVAPTINSPSINLFCADMYSLELLSISSTNTIAVVT